MPSGVFVCHASQDAATALEVVAVLEAAGTPCWIAPRDVPAGTRYTDAIMAALRAAPAVVVLVSAAAARSPHVERELEFATDAGERILPVRLDDVEPGGSLRYYIGNAQWLDLGGRRREVWAADLVAMVGGYVDADAAPAVPEPAVAPARPELPALRGATWGRDALRDDVARELTDGRARLVTLTGLGGIGKTRLALEVAHTLAGRGVAVTYAVGTPRDDGRSGLLVVDDPASSPDGVERVGQALVEAPGLTALTTSRLPLGLPGERVVVVPPLAMSDDEDSPAVQLMLSALQATGTPTGSSTSGTTELCRLLDGVPQWLLTAAARAKVVGPQRLVGELRTSLDALPEVAEGISWTLDRVGPEDAALLRRLGVFVGWFGLEEAEAVWPEPRLVEAVSRLVDTGLLRLQAFDHRIHYRLPPPVRLVALAGLSSGELVESRTRRAAVVGRLVPQWAASLDTADGPRASDEFALSAADVDDVLAGLLAEGRAEDAAELALASASMWLAAGDLSTTRQRFREILAGLPGDGPPAPRLLVALGRLSYHLNDWAAATDELSRGLALALREGDDEAAVTARCYLGGTKLMDGKVEEGVALATDASHAAESLDLYPLVVEALSLVAISHAIAGRFDQERATHERRLDVARKHGDIARTADALNTLAEIALDEDDAESARDYVAESLRLAADRFPLEARDATITLARAEAAAGRIDVAGDRLREALERCRRVGQHLALAQCLRVGGVLSLAREDPALAVRLFAAAQALSPSPSGTEEPVEHDFAAALAAARAALGAGRSTREWTLGQGLPADSLVDQLLTRSP